MRASGSGEHGDQAVPLDEVHLFGIAAELVAVHDDGVGDEHHAQASEPAAEAELGVLVVHEELGLEGPQLLPDGAPEDHRRSRGARDVALDGVGSRRIAEPTTPRVTEEVDLVARRVDPRWVVVESQACRSRCRRRPLQRRV